MEAVARAARISRPGLYFLFSSKEALFAAAVTQTLEHDLAEVERLLTEADEPLRQRLQHAFDQWAGRYVGPLSREVSAVIEGNPDVLGTIVQAAPRRFEELVTDAISRDLGPHVAAGIAQTLISTSIGIKHQVDARGDYLAQLVVAIDLLVPITA
jgi:AcrR family transcriptional regulator